MESLPHEFDSYLHKIASNFKKAKIYLWSFAEIYLVLDQCIH